MSSRAYRLQTDEGVAEGVRRVARGRAEKALERLGSADADEQLAGAVHGARKDLKKLRALLRLLREELGADLFKAESRRCRDAGRLLSGPRDAQVKLETLIALREAAAGELLAAETALWESELEAERDAAVAALREESAELERAREEIAAGRERIGEWPLRHDGWKLVGPGLRRSYRDGRRGMKAVRKGFAAEDVHAWRKRVKDLWHQLWLIREAWPAPLAATAEAAHELAELLGDHHDLAVLAEDLGSRWGVSGKASFEAAIERRQHELLAAALAIGSRLYAEKPAAFSGRLETYWMAWRGE